MVLQVILDIVKTVLFNVLSFINIPEFPESLTSAIDSVINLIFQNSGFVGFVVRWDTLKVAIPLLIAIINMQHIYDGIMWILRKIPALGIE